MERRGRPRLFDHDEARKLCADGLSYSEIARRFGVTGSAIRQACDESYRDRVKARAKIWQASGKCADCGATCSRNPSQRPVTRCKACSFAVRHYDSIAEASLRCCECKHWKPDEDFYPKPPSQANDGPRRDRKAICIACENVKRSERRRAARARALEAVPVGR